ncbi:hypothetical protein [Coleofasciculus sp.]|uniref:hypothetical protein n=1 Tax=Coleofasciculus sp. TaxID=3100458 RepID=UPI0039FAB272
MSKPAHPRKSLSSNNSPADKNSNPDSHSLEENTTADESYNFQKARIIVHLEILPSSEDNQNRLVNIGVGIKNDPPLLTTTTLSELNLPPVIQQMLEELQSQMPERAAAAIERKMWRQKQEDPDAYEYLLRKFVETSEGRRGISAASLGLDCDTDFCFDMSIQSCII